MSASTAPPDGPITVWVNSRTVMPASGRRGMAVIALRTKPSDVAIPLLPALGATNANPAASSSFAAAIVVRSP